MKSKISLIILILSASALSQSPFKIISSDFRSIVIEFSPTKYNTEERIIDNQKFYDIYFDGSSVQTSDWGEPSVPEYILNIGVPDETGNTIETINSQYTEIDGKLAPVPALERDGNLDKDVYKVSGNYYKYKPSDEVVTFGDFGIIRSVKVQTVKILPVKYFPGTDKIRLYNKVVFKLNFGPHQVYSNKTNDDLAESAIINYQVSKNWNDNSKRIGKINIINSVLSTGKWFRFEAPVEGIYKITRDMLSSYGIDPNTVVPSTIKIYNNGGKILPEDPRSQRPVDLEENNIWVVGEEDGKFDDNDYILFYGRGNSFWDYDTLSKSIQRYFHLYSNVNYYWITSGGSNGKRIQDKPGVNTTPDYVQNSTYAFADWDIDRINVGKTGRIFAGDDFSQNVTSRTYMNNLDFRIDGTPILYKFNFINASEDPFLFKLFENSNQIFSQNFPGYSSNPYSAGNKYVYTVSYNATLPDNRSVLRFEINQTLVNSIGYLDYFEITYQKELKPTNNSLLLFSNDISGIVEYRLSNFPSTNIRVFDVTNYSSIKYITNHTLLSGGECRFQMTENQGHVSKYLCVGNNDFKTPSNPAEVGNSDLHGISAGAKFIIITHKNFRDAAEKLKAYRENEAKVKISTVIVDIQEIFNEFSCGIVDISAMRDFLKYAYENWQIQPEYVLFFGSGNYDYKNVEGYNANYIPTFQSTESLDLFDSYTSDDFFAKFDNGNIINADLANGRIPCRTPEEANTIVDKIIQYEKGGTRGLWRNNITLVADDGYTSTGYEGSEHTAPSETLASVYIPKSFDINKIYMAAYPIVLTGSGKRMPDVNQAIIDAINQGTLIMNYIGHGSSELWAHEVVFEKSTSIPQLHNEDFTFLVAATCSFGYFDIPNFQCGAEAMLFLKNAGTIGSVASSRLAESSSNHFFLYRFFTSLLISQRDTLNLNIPVGKALFSSKNTSINDRRYFLFGDPTLRLAVPQYFGEIDSINGQTLETNVQIKALSNVKVDGFVKDANGNKWNDFNGEGLLTVYDSEGSDSLEQIRYSVKVPGGVIFKGRVSVNNGRFSSTFVVPKDISYENKNGKVLLYFFGNDEDGISFTNSVIVGGTDSSVVNDNTGPQIDIYFDDTSYQNAYLANPNSQLIVKLSDESGINTTGTGVGHRLEGILNDKESDPIDFTKYFTGDLDAGGKAGQVNYALENLDDGEYKLYIKAWDVFNNFSSETTYFTVVSGSDLTIRDIYNYPNPFSSSTTFTFQQNLNSIIDVEVKIYTIAGRLIKVLNKDNVREKFVSVDWDGRDKDGSNIANGTYLYKLKVKTVDGQYSKSVLGKLAVIR